MDITPDKAEGLAQRALELARNLDPHFPPQELSDEEKAEVCQALLHYAEILPKWQAVLDAEPVAKVAAFDDCSNFVEWLNSDNLDDGTQLIIKPAT